MLKIDLHTHSLRSGHALNTVYELAAEAKARGLAALGVAEHGPAMQGAPHEGYFWVADQLEECLGLPIFLGIEANILDGAGTLDLSPALLARQRNVLAGLHERTPYAGRCAQDHTRALVAAMGNPYVRIISHPYRSEFPVDIEQVVEAACRQGVLLELNNALFTKERDDPHFIETYKRMVGLCAARGHPLVIGSDAHVAHRIGDDGAVRAAAAAIGLRDDMIINTTPTELIRWKRTS